MPAFTFEKISPEKVIAAARRGPIAPITRKQRGLIVQMLDRFVAARVKRSLREEKTVLACDERKPQD